VSVCAKSEEIPSRRYWDITSQVRAAQRFRGIENKMFARRKLKSDECSQCYNLLLPAEKHFHKLLILSTVNMKLLQLSGTNIVSFCFWRDKQNKTNEPLMCFNETVKCNLWQFLQVEYKENTMTSSYWIILHLHLTRFMLFVFCCFFYIKKPYKKAYKQLILWPCWNL